MSMHDTTSPWSLRPETGLPWCPVIAVVRLSSTTTVAAPPLKREMRECRDPRVGKVESPMTATTGRPSAPSGRGEPVSHTDARAHAHAGVHRVQRGQRGQGIAADVPRDNRLGACARHGRRRDADTPGTTVEDVAGDLPRSPDAVESATPKAVAHPPLERGRRSSGSRRPRWRTPAPQTLDVEVWVELLDDGDTRTPEAKSRNETLGERECQTLA